MKGIIGLVAGVAGVILVANSAYTLGATLIILFSIAGTEYVDTAGVAAGQTLGANVRDAAFQVVSIQTTTGFATIDFDKWAVIPQAVLIILMFIGGCGGSTGGGIKVIRIFSAMKIMAVELEKAFRPNVLRSVKVGGHMVEYHQRISVLSYVLGIIILFCVGAAALMITDPQIDGITAATASIASVNNIGPGLAAVGATQNYGWFSDAGKLVLCLLMAIGRLEVFAVLVIFMPKFWRTA